MVETWNVYSEAEHRWALKHRVSEMRSKDLTGRWPKKATQDSHRKAALKPPALALAGPGDP